MPDVRFGSQADMCVQQPMSAIGQKQAFATQAHVRFTPESGHSPATGDVRFGPIADIATIFDDLICLRECRVLVGAAKSYFTRLEFSISNSYLRFAVSACATCTTKHTGAG